MELPTPSASAEAAAEVMRQELLRVQELTGLTAVGDILFVDSGWTSRVYVCRGGRWVIKFPRTEAVKREYAREIQVLTLLEGAITSIRLPKVRWTDEANAFLGYEGIVGRELASHTTDVEVDGKRAIGAALGTFLKQLHGRTVDVATTTSVRDEITEFQEKYAMSGAVIARDFSPEEQTRLHHLVHVEMPSELLELGSDPAFCHGDLGYWNMILEADGHRIGVIDFGDAGYYDRAKDFVGLEDREILDAALQAYGDDDSLRAKIAIRQKVLAVLDLPFFIGKHDEAGIALTVAKIRSGLTRRP